MTKEFTYEHKPGAQKLKVEIYFSCSTPEGDGLDWGCEWIEEVETGIERKLEDFPAELRAGIEACAWDLAQTHSEAAYKEYIEGEADRLYDQWRDRDE